MIPTPHPFRSLMNITEKEVRARKTRGVLPWMGWITDAGSLPGRSFYTHRVNTLLHSRWHGGFDRPCDLSSKTASMLRIFIYFLIVRFTLVKWLGSGKSVELKVPVWWTIALFLHWWEEYRSHRSISNAVTELRIAWRISSARYAFVILP